MRFDKSFLCTWTNRNKTSQIDHVLASEETLIKTKFIRAGWTTIHKMLIVAIETMQWKSENNMKKRRSQLLPSVLQQKEPKEIFHDQLNKYELIDVESLEITEAYEKFIEKMASSARKALQYVKDPMTPKRKKAVEALLKARKRMKLAKQRGVDIALFRENINIKRHEYSLAVREHNEKEIFKFYNELQDYEVGERIKRSYKYLKKFVKRKAPKKPSIALEKLIEEL